MNEELYFNDELRKCLNAAGLSDCGENDAWNYWYHRVHKAHDQAVDRVTEAQRAENAKLRELVERLRTQLADMTESVGRVEERCAKTFEVGKRWMAKAARFEAENAKLRELVDGLEYCVRGSVCDCCCPLYDPSGADHRRCESLERELGIEVDE